MVLQPYRQSNVEIEIQQCSFKIHIPFENGKPALSFILKTEILNGLFLFNKEQGSTNLSSEIYYIQIFTKKGFQNPFLTSYDFVNAVLLFIL